MKSIVTVITPTYNHEKYIVKCIDSVLNQTYKNWRMIIVEDFSSDKTREIVEEYAKKDKRISIVKHRSHWGIPKLAKTYNQAINLSKTKYVAFLEGDDFWPKDKLEKQLTFIKNKDVVFSYGDCVLTGENGLPLKLYTYTNHDKDFLRNYPRGSVLRLFATLNFSPFMSTIIMRRNDFLSVGGFQNDGHYPFPDTPSFLKLALKGNFAYQNNILGYYRKHQTSAWFEFAGKSSAMAREELGKSINTFLKKKSGNKYVYKILHDKDLMKKQKAYIESKKTRKGISILVNNIAFKFKINPLFAVFVAEYISYKFKQIFYENRN